MTSRQIEFKVVRQGAEMASLGQSLSSYVASFQDDRRSELESSSLAILDLALRKGNERSSVLVLGQVQSGKTSSIIGLVAVARDNGYPFVVLASGSTELLQSQTLSRLKSSLINEQTYTDWAIMDKLTNADVPYLETLLSKWSAWRAGTSDIKPPTVVVTPLKTAGLQKTASALREAFKSVGEESPLLIIDDESDSATPNTQSRRNFEKGLDERSATSRRVKELFECSTSSKYIMYTATPQANLLMEIDEVLNPDYAHILRPGPGYMGLQYFFLSPARAKHLRSIPTGEVINERSRKFPDHETAIFAIASFVVGCAIQIKVGKVVMTDSSHVRSMMMQVAQSKEAHRHFLGIARFQIDSWRRAFDTGTLQAEDSHIFERAALDISTTTGAAFEAGDLLLEIKEVLDHVRVVLMNSENKELRRSLTDIEATDRVNWSQARFWILVGGMFMDRGFTVEGLQVTYMPRKPALNEDSITQRGRFFGYHQKYRDYIRLFMPDALQNKYIDIAHNAEDLRKRVASHADDISSWIRNFRVSKGTSPTRKAAIGRGMDRTTKTWIYPGDLHHINEHSRLNNIRIVTGLMSEILGSGALPSHGSKFDVYAEEKALIFEDIPIRGTYERLASFRYSPDSEGPDFLARQMRDALEEGHEAATLIFIDHLRTEKLLGKNLDPIGLIGNLLWSGRSQIFVESYGKPKYPNDRDIFNPDQPTIQLRLVKSNPLTEDVTEKKLFAWWAWMNPNLDDRLKERR